MSRTNIPIPITSIIITIKRERTCIAAIIRVTANIQTTPTIGGLSYGHPLIYFNKKIN
jgi:hypothetical protein